MPIPFPRVLALYEIHSASSKIWTQVVMSISYDDKHYTSGTSTPVDYLMLNSEHVKYIAL